MYYDTIMIFVFNINVIINNCIIATYSRHRYNNVAIVNTVISHKFIEPISLYNQSILKNKTAIKSIDNYHYHEYQNQVITIGNFKFKSFSIVDIEIVVQYC